MENNVTIRLSKNNFFWYKKTIYQFNNIWKWNKRSLAVRVFEETDFFSWK